MTQLVYNFMHIPHQISPIQVSTITKFYKITYWYKHYSLNRNLVALNKVSWNKYKNARDVTLDLSQIKLKMKKE